MKSMVIENEFGELYGRLSNREIKRISRESKKSTSITRETPHRLERKKIEPKTENQRKLLDSIHAYTQIVATGPAGTGKTYVATYEVANMFLERKIKKIVLTRPNVSASKSIGLLPGDKDEKFANWTIPFTEVLKEVLGIGMFECAVKSGQIEVVPFEFMRGRTFNDSAVIVDECQSTTEEEVCLLVTRVGVNSKLIMLGDVKQKDIKTYSGLEYVLKSIDQNSELAKSVSVIEFDISDIVRSHVCAVWARHIYKN